jgi:integrase
MAYIIERNNRFYVVAYDGIDPLTGRERRRWHPAGRSRADAEAIAATLDTQHSVEVAEETSPITLCRYLTEQWLPFRKNQLRPTTFRRYSWIVENYINPRLGDIQLRRLRAEHLDRLYLELLTTGNKHGEPLAPKTVYDVHVVLRACLGDAKRRHYLATNIALEARPPRPQAQARKGPETWTAEQLRAYLDSTGNLRLQPAIYIAATTGMRRGEVAGLRWGDWQQATHRVSIARSRQVVGGRSMEVPCKTKTSRRSVDLDKTTEKVLARWKRRQQRDGHPTGLDDPIFTNTDGNAIHPESVTQLFDRNIVRAGVPRIRFHDLRHTHASLLVAAGTPIKVVSERLGHSHPGFTMATYQHLIPGMSSQAATDFANMLHPNKPATRRRKRR